MTATAPSIKPDTILSELDELWTSLSTPESGKSKTSGVLRACAMTLTVFVDADGDSTSVQETVAQLMRAHPSRAIVVRLSEQPNILESRVFAQCWMPLGHERQICCEQIEISVSLSLISDIPSIVGPLAAPDVPRVVWFRSPRIEMAGDIGGLFELGDKLVVDSARPGAPSFADLRVLANSGYILGDLAWTRITKLRQLLAQLLDGRALNAIRRITIHYSGGVVPAEAKYLRAWFRSIIETADVDLRQSDSAGNCRIITVDIAPDIHVKVMKNCAEYEAGLLSEHANLGEPSETNLLDEELNIMIHDPMFERTLQRMTVWAPRS